MLFGIERREINRGESGTLQLQQTRGEFGTDFVAGDGFVDAIGVRPEVFGRDRVAKGGRGLGEAQSDFVGSARLRPDLRLNLFPVFRPSHNLQGVAIRPQYFIEASLVRGRQDRATPVHRGSVAHRLVELPVLVVWR